MTRQFTPKSADQRRAEVAALTARLDAGTSAILTGEHFAAWLRLLARLHAYSFGNVCLIYAQMPDASMVAGYRAWQALGRQVRKGETAIKILAPIVARRDRDDAATADDPTTGPSAARSVVGYRVASVFDVAQTEGDALPDGPRPATLSGDSPAAAHVTARLAAWAIGQGVTVSDDASGLRATTRGSYRAGVGGAGPVITVRPDLAPDQRAKTLAHELAHWRAGHVAGMPAADAETVAEGVAYVVCAHAGMTGLDDASFPYVAGWAQDPAVVKRNLGAIRAIAHDLIEVIDAAPATAIPEAAPVEADGPPAVVVTRAGLQTLLPGHAPAPVPVKAGSQARMF